MKNKNDALAVTRNCENAQKRIGDALTVAHYHVSELAQLIADGISNGTARETYAELRGSLAPSELEGVVSGVVTSCIVAELCKEVCERAEGLQPFDFLTSEGDAENSKIAYIRTSASDEAYRIFSSVIDGASVVYPGSFAAVCEEVYYGRAGYCILPYESSDEGTLTGFMRLIRKYELCPNLICSVTGESNVTRFVLLGRSQYPSVYSVKSKRRYLKLSIDSSSSGTVAELTGAAAQLGYTLCKTESVPVSWDDGRYAISLTFDVTGSDVTPFLLYLELEIPECAEISAYSEV